MLGCIAVSGVGGVGKTELLLQALSAVENGRPVLWVAVERYRSSTEVLAALNGALDGTSFEDGDTSLAQKLDTLQACLVFDGVERAALADLDAFENMVASLWEAVRDTQIVLTTQVSLHGVPVECRMKLEKLDAASSRGLLTTQSPTSRSQPEVTLVPLLDFCDGHALTLRLAAALCDHYEGPTGALKAIEANGLRAVRMPGRRELDARHSLELCLRTAYDTLAADSRRLFWALAESPAGIIVSYMHSGWPVLQDAADALAELRRWHLVEISGGAEHLRRANLLSPVRLFALNQAQDPEAAGAYRDLLRALADSWSLMVAVLETRYDNPEDAPYLIERYDQELPNLMRMLDRAHSSPGDHRLARAAISIGRALMRYFFVRGRTEEGAQIMQQAAELAQISGNAAQASALALQLTALADRANDAPRVKLGVEIAEAIERRSTDPEVSADAALCRGLAAWRVGDLASAETEGQKAWKGYGGLLRAARSIGSAEAELEDIHNDLSHALNFLGRVLLDANRYQEAADFYRHALKHNRGASIAVNRGQTLHQLGNCESHLGRFSEAARHYRAAAEFFRFVGMREYLSNASGELGYALLDLEGADTNGLDADLLQSALDDLEEDIGRVFRPDCPVDHGQAVSLIRKTFGSIILSSVTGQASYLFDYTRRLSERLRLMADQVRSGVRARDELFPLMVMDTALSLGFYAAQGEAIPEDDDEGLHFVVGEMLQIVCNAHPWTRTTMRTIDWLTLLLTHSWKLTGADRKRLHAFVRNFDDNITDWLDVQRR